MVTQRVRANGIEIAYDVFGDPSDPALLLVMGLNTQRLAWPDPFCEELAGAGYHVIRFDNRDAGESTHLDGLPAPSPVSVVLHRRRPVYVLDDLATDTLAFLDALGLDRVHLVGASMGGFIAQLVAIRAPDRIASLTLIMTSTGSRLVGRTKPNIIATVLRRKPAADRVGAVEASVDMFRLIGSKRYPFDDSMIRQLAEESYDRGYDPDGARRQLAAVLAQTDRTRDLGRIAVPTLVMHGLDDPLVAPSGGLALARAIEGARFVGFHGMGHDLPQPLWPDFVREIVAITRRAARSPA
jgi:pimeloyl-ACP methyl ester carboxylesterase